MVWMLAEQIAVRFKLLQQIGVFVGGLISCMQLLDLIDFQELHTQKVKPREVCTDFAFCL